MNAHDPAGEFQVPLHRRIAEDLNHQVVNGSLKPGEKLPSERQIADQFQASRATVRTALGHLEQEGLITRRQRRSAIVAIRRDLAPSIRIACTHPRLMHLFERFSDMHILPGRSQLQLFDFQMESIGQLAAKAATAADILICEMEYVRCFEGREKYYTPLSPAMVHEFRIPETVLKMCRAGSDYIAVPLGISPMMLYYDRVRFRQSDSDPNRALQTWDQTLRLAQQCAGSGRYGLQLRPIFSHLAAFFASHGSQLYNAEGRIAASEVSFQQDLKHLHDLLHLQRVIPLLAKVEQLNPFAQRRCAMAIDGLDMLSFYQDKLGQDLGLGVLPHHHAQGPMLSGVVAVILSGGDNPQMAYDTLRTLLSANSQRILSQSGGGLPVRDDLLHLEALRSLGIGAEMSQIALGELQRAKPVNLPKAAEHKHAVENLFLELWLGLDTIENLMERFRKL